MHTIKLSPYRYEELLHRQSICDDEGWAPLGEFDHKRRTLTTSTYLLGHLLEEVTNAVDIMDGGDPSPSQYRSMSNLLRDLEALATEHGWERKRVTTSGHYRAGWIHPDHRPTLDADIYTGDGAHLTTVHDDTSTTDDPTTDDPKEGAAMSTKTALTVKQIEAEATKAAAAKDDKALGQLLVDEMHGNDKPRVTAVDAIVTKAMSIEDPWLPRGAGKPTGKGGVKLTMPNGDLDLLDDATRDAAVEQYGSPLKTGVRFDDTAGADLRSISESYVEAAKDYATNGDLTKTWRSLGCARTLQIVGDSADVAARQAEEDKAAKAASGDTEAAVETLAAEYNALVEGEGSDMADSEEE